MKPLIGPYFLFSCLLSMTSGCHHATEPPAPVPPDTTSHSIVWQKELFGVAASSYLLDVAIINDTLAYAVGTVWLEDRPGHLDPLSYDLLKWNGHTWTPMHAGIGGDLRAVCAFSENDIWVAYGLPEHWNGYGWTLYDPPGIPHLVANRFWGTSSHDLYMASDSGGIAHFDGSSWTRLQTGTALNVRDIYGAKDPQTGTWEILAVASNQYESHDRRVFSLTGEAATLLPDAPVGGALTSCWFLPNVGPYYVAGAGIFKKDHLTDSLWLYKPLDFTPYYTEIVRGTAANDVFAAGDFGDVLHFSGKTWKSYHSETHFASGLFLGMAIRGNLIIIVGEEAPDAVILIGRRMQ
jgi:hypothetical protein